MDIIRFDSMDKLYSKIKELKAENYYFLGEFLEEIDEKTDNLLVLLYKNNKEILIMCQHSNQEELPPISDIFYAAHLFENEIYDFYGKPTKGKVNYILRLHNYPLNYFPKRKLGKPLVEQKTPYIFTNIKAEGIVKSQVGPIHAGIIPPGHFRFTCDGEDVLNLDIQLGWTHKGVEKYFLQETDLYKLLQASGEIAGDSCVASNISFVKLVEQSANLKVDKFTIVNRVLFLELERIYNHLWTIGAMLNDVGQGYLLNGFLEIREKFLNLNAELFGSRLLKGLIDFGKNNKNLTSEGAKKLAKLILSQQDRFENLVHIAVNSAGIYDRLFTTGLVKKQTAIEHSSLGLSAKASGLKQDYRQFDEYYLSTNLIPDIYVGENGDTYDRFYVRVQEVRESFKLLNKIINFLEINGFEIENKNIDFKLTDGYFTARTEGHRGENLQLVHVENGKIKYYKFKDPSFVNWSLLEYAVLKNIIADFPICNKSFDLSYSGFDV